MTTIEIGENLSRVIAAGFVTILILGIFHFVTRD